MSQQTDSERTRTLMKYPDAIRYQAFVHLAQELIATIDGGECGKVTARETIWHIGVGDVLQWLRSLAPPEAVYLFALFKGGGTYMEAGIDWLEGLRILVQNHIAHRRGVDRCGLCLLLTLTLELLQEEVNAVTEKARQAVPFEPHRGRWQ